MSEQNKNDGITLVPAYERAFIITALQEYVGRYSLSAFDITPDFEEIRVLAGTLYDIDDFGEPIGEPIKLAIRGYTNPDKKLAIVCRSDGSSTRAYNLRSTTTDIELFSRQDHAQQEAAADSHLRRLLSKTEFSLQDAEAEMAQLQDNPLQYEKFLRYSRVLKAA